MIIDARNLAAALAYMGADVESALLEISAASPSLDAKVRAALFHHEEPAKLRYISDRNRTNAYFVHVQHPRWTCAAHAADQITRVLDDGAVVQYLQARFADYHPEVLLDGDS